MTEIDRRGARGRGAAADRGAARAATRRSSPAGSDSALRSAARWCASPTAFLMDEPLSNLDAKLRVHMRSELAELHDRLGTTFIYVTHDQVEAMTMSDRRRDDGRRARFSSSAAPRALYARPANVRVAQFIGSRRSTCCRACVGASGCVELFGAELPIRVRAGVGSALTIGMRPEAITPAAHGNSRPGAAHAARTPAAQREPRRRPHPARRSRRTRERRDHLHDERRSGTPMRAMRAGSRSISRRRPATCSTPTASASPMPRRRMPRSRRLRCGGRCDGDGHARATGRVAGAAAEPSALDRAAGGSWLRVSGVPAAAADQHRAAARAAVSELHQLRARRARHRASSASTTSARRSAIR